MSAGRVLILVMDSVGVGGAPDAALFRNGDGDDEGAATVPHIAQACAEGRAEEGRSGPLRAPNLTAMGLGEACRIACGATPPGLEATGPFQGVYGAGQEFSAGKDTITGHWELAGAPMRRDWHYFPRAVPALPERLTDALIRRAGLPGLLGNKHASGTEILDELGAESLRTGKPIIYTSADSVIQIAAHEQAFGLERLYELCRIARELADELNVGRVIARPFLGDPATGFRRTANRKDFSTPPPEPTLCDRALEAGRQVFGVGKIADIFAGRGIGAVLKGADDMALCDRTLEAMRDAGPGDLIFANFVDFDSLYGHRRDVSGYARAIEAFDARLPELFAAMGDQDLMIVAADHGNDPTWRGTDHTRERVPILCRGARLRPGSAGLRRFADVAETAARWLGLPAGPHGRAMLAPAESGAWRAAPETALGPFAVAPGREEGA
ncbi:phosphopentomutase [Oceanicella actignis]|uniref:Phosphopentomutase n=1 Tax=Oceanicella actignis TaxID=1189325 RepID=A0A1M7SGG0_9RHOB|nr:phosphopentomutase [Oceanicella actignis]TYO91268.1 phosphopentomutase [Oceanicella actignis]SET21138.1 phosphopentomutase [Oceanicella actignis]SHN57558.1 phosphopentomutase [Oceanicella actignis]